MKEKKEGSYLPSNNTGSVDSEDSLDGLEGEVQIHFPPGLFPEFFKMRVPYSELSNSEIYEYLFEESVPRVIATPLDKRIKKGDEFIVSVSPEKIYVGDKMSDREMFEEGEVINGNEGYVEINTQFNKVLYEAWRRNLFAFENWREQLAEMRIEYFIEKELPVMKRRLKFGRRNLKNHINDLKSNNHRFEHNPIFH